jgi:hypothetical protein
MAIGPNHRLADEHHGPSLILTMAFVQSPVLCATEHTQTTTLGWTGPR